MNDDKGGHPRFHELLKEIGELHSKKNADYAGGGQTGALDNFNRLSRLKKVWPNFDWSSPFGVAMSYMLKQFDAALFLYEQQKESMVGEGIPERLKDVSVYSLIGMIIIEEENNGKAKRIEETDAPGERGC